MNRDVVTLAKQFWTPERLTKVRTTFGPALAGLVGGAMLGLVALPNMAQLCSNMAATYAEFPSVHTPLLAVAFKIPFLPRMES